uniref:clusterin-like protein 1 n=1 Tax=Oncorhynchus gorbuscha TaxID=8017 RepID=UPI001EAEBB6D|nr:clusterin-like protein 1 [Oncorhynchus gorbuscha]XP_046176768.1 clusterin-like protein 1 [Oncorhynchus gorbuscha]
MRFLIGWVVLVMSFGVLQCAAEDPAAGISEDTLKQLSDVGEKLVDEEVRRALYGVKQMKEVLVKNEEKHEDLMKSLQHSSDKKKGVAQLYQEVELKLEEAEHQCQESLKEEWEACWLCLEDACKTFYTSTCRQGFSSFQAKVENLFRGESSRFGQRDPRPLDGDMLVNQSADKPDREVVRIEDSFNSLIAKVGSLFERSVVLVDKMQGKLDQNLQKAFDPQSRGQARGQQPTQDPLFLGMDLGFIHRVGLEEVLDSFFNFGKSVVEDFGDVVTQVFDDLKDVVEEERKRETELFPHFLQNRKLCRELRRQTSECWQLQNQCQSCQGVLLTECPSVRELHVEMDEVSQLRDMSKEQYDEVLSIVQQHTGDMARWISNMATEFGWVTEMVNNNTTPDTIFRIRKVVSEGVDGGSSSGGDTKVELNILNSPPLLLTIPAGVELQDPAFINFVAQEALGMYKQMFRHNDD